PPVIGRLRLAEPGDAARGRIAVGPRLAQRLLQFLDHMGRRRQVRVAHAEVDDVGTGVPRGRLGPVDLFEHVRRQTADAVKIFHGTLAPTTGKTESREPWRFEAEFGFVQKSRLIKDLERIQAQGPSSGPAMRLNWGSFYHGSRAAPAIRAFSSEVDSGSRSNQVYADCVDLSAVKRAKTRI